MQVGAKTAQDGHKMAPDGPRMARDTILGSFWVFFGPLLGCIFGVFWCLFSSFVFDALFVCFGSILSLVLEVFGAGWPSRERTCHFAKMTVFLKENLRF